MNKKKVSFITTLALVVALLTGEVALPALALADTGKGKGVEKSAAAKINKEKSAERSHNGDVNKNDDRDDNKNDDRDDDRDDTEEKHRGNITVVSATTTPAGNGNWLLRLELLLTGGAGKSGKIPPGLLHAPGIWKKISGFFHGSTTPDTLAPTLLNITVNGISTSSATVHWTSSEKTRSVLYYGTSSPVVIASSTASVSSNKLLIAHDMKLTGLSPQTLYRAKIVGTDASGNATTSAEFTFTTLALPDTTAPTLSAISVSDLASTSARVSWTTDESATGKVYYSTTSPVVIGGAQTTLLSTSTLSTSHSFLLTGLSASTTYRYLVSSTDGSSNATTSGELSFTTGN